MSDFFTRMVERTLGSDRVVRPLVSSMFAKRSIETDYSFSHGDVTGEAEVPFSLIIDKEGSPAHGGHGPVSPSMTKMAGKTNKAGASSENNSNPPEDMKEREIPPELKKLEVPKTRYSKINNKTASGGDEPVSDVAPSKRRPDNSVSYHDYQGMQNLSFGPEKLAGDDSFSSVRMNIGPERAEVSENMSTSVKTATKESRSFNGRISSFDLKKPSRTITEKREAGDGTSSAVPCTVKKVIYPYATGREKQIKQGLPGHRSDSKETPSPPPTIKVTIGRIDISAVEQNTPRPQRRTRSTPGLSLDDYLKQRGGGR